MKKLYKHFNNIDINIDELNSIDVNLDELTKNRIKKNLRKSVASKKNKTFKHTGIAAAISFGLLFGSAHVIHNSFPAFAAFTDNLPVVNSLFRKFSSSYGGNFENYSQIIGEAKNSKGYEVKIDEIAMDDFSFKLIYTIKCPQKVSDILNKSNTPFPHTPGKRIKIDNKDFLGGCGGSDRIVDEYTVQVIEDFDLKNTKIPNTFNMEIDFKEINDVNGNWNFKFSVSKEKISKEIKNFSCNKELKIKNDEGKDITIKFEKFSFSPISTAIFLKATDDFNISNLHFKDSSGNEIKDNGISLSCNSLALGYKATGLYKFIPFEKIPEKIIAEYVDKTSNKIESVELLLDAEDSENTKKVD